MIGTGTRKGRTVTGKEDLIVGLSPEEIEAIEDQNYTSRERKELEVIYEDNIGSRQLKPGSIVTGKLLRRVGKEVIVDINYKSEGIIPLSEFAKGEEIIPGAVSRVEVGSPRLPDRGKKKGVGNLRPVLELEIVAGPHGDKSMVRGEDQKCILHSPHQLPANRIVDGAQLSDVGIGLWPSDMGDAVETGPIDGDERLPLRMVQQVAGRDEHVRESSGWMG